MMGGSVSNTYSICSSELFILSLNPINFKKLPHHLPRLHSRRVMTSRTLRCMPNPAKWKVKKLLKDCLK
jgi:hypothetical protein